jgi:hypothetical protein
MEKKREEFRKLVQGDMDVDSYSRAFTRLARYAGDEVATDAKKQDKFRRGLNPAIKFTINLFRCNTERTFSLPSVFGCLITIQGI